MTETSHKTLAEALVAFQAEAPALPKDATNPHFKSRFTSLDAIGEAIRPLLAKHGLAWSTRPSFGPAGEPALTYQLLHRSGETVSDTMPLLLDKTNSQGLGSAISYARRYSVTAVLNLVCDEDDDGHRASTPPKPASKAPPRPAPRSPDLVTSEDIKALQAAAKGLKAAQVKQAMASCNVTPPDPFVPASCFLRVPRDKAQVLVEALSSADVPWAGELPAADPVAPEV